MKRANSFQDVATTGRVQVDSGEGVTLEIPVTPYAPYDSGERDITALLADIVSGRLLLERTGLWVSLNFQELDTGGEAGGYATWSGILPTGFRPSMTSPHIDLPLSPRLNTTTQGSLRVSRYGELRVYRLGGPTTGVVHFRTRDPIPTSLPGDPA